MGCTIHNCKSRPATNDGKHGGWEDPLDPALNKTDTPDTDTDNKHDGDKGLANDIGSASGITSISENTLVVHVFAWAQFCNPAELARACHIIGAFDVDTVGRFRLEINEPADVMQIDAARACMKPAAEAFPIVQWPEVVQDDGTTKTNKVHFATDTKEVSASAPDTTCDTVAQLHSVYRQNVKIFLPRGPRTHALELAILATMHKCGFRHEPYDVQRIQVRKALGVFHTFPVTDRLIFTFVGSKAT